MQETCTKILSTGHSTSMVILMVCSDGPGWKETTNSALKKKTLVQPVETMKGCKHHSCKRAENSTSYSQRTDSFYTVAGTICKRCIISKINTCIFGTTAPWQLAASLWIYDSMTYNDFHHIVWHNASRREKVCSDKNTLVSITRTIRETCWQVQSF